MTHINDGYKLEIRESSYVIAASDSSLIDYADDVCRGTSDQVTIQNIINDITSGGKLLLLDGTYNFNGKIEITQNDFVLSGLGSSTIIKLVDAGNSDLIWIGDNTNPYQNITVKDLQIDGNYANNTELNLSGIRVTDYCNDIKILNNHVHDVRRFPIVCWSGVPGDLNRAGNFNWIEIAFNKVWNLRHVAIEVFYGGNHINIHDNFVYGNPSVEVGVETFGITVNIGSATGNDSKDVLIANNLLDASSTGFSEVAIDLYSTSSGKRFYNPIVCNNTVRNSEYGIVVIHLQNGVVCNNTVTDSKYHFCVWKCNRVTVSNNYSENGEYGIYFINSYRCVGVGNIIHNNQYAALEIQGSQYCTYSSNTLHNVCQAANNTYNAIDIYAYNAINPLYNLITNNLILEDATNKAKYGISEDASSDYNLIHGNSVWGAVTSKVNVVGLNSVSADNI